jgi:hypothetical protein
MQSVLDWLTGSGDWMEAGDAPGPFLVNPSVGHTLAAAACHVVALGMPLTDPTAPTAQPAQFPDERQAYALRHAVAHMCLAVDMVSA